MLYVLILVLVVTDRIQRLGCALPYTCTVAAKPPCLNRMQSASKFRKVTTSLPESAQSLEQNLTQKPTLRPIISLQLLTKITEIMKMYSLPKKQFCDARPSKSHSVVHLYSLSKNKLCDQNECQEVGIYPAPKNYLLKEKYYFCLQHIKEYNSSWNFFKKIKEDCEFPINVQEFLKFF